MFTTIGARRRYRAIATFGLVTVLGYGAVSSAFAAPGCDVQAWQQNNGRINGLGAVMIEERIQNPASNPGTALSISTTFQYTDRATYDGLYSPAPFGMQVSNDAANHRVTITTGGLSPGQETGVVLRFRLPITRSWGSNTIATSSACIGVPPPPPPPPPPVCASSTWTLTTTSFALKRECKYQINYQGYALSNEDEAYEIDTRGFGTFYGPGSSANSQAVVTRYIHTGDPYYEGLGVNMQVQNLRWNGTQWIGNFTATAIGNPTFVPGDAEGTVLAQKTDAFFTSTDTLKFIHWLEGNDGTAPYSVDFTGRGLWASSVTVTQSP